MSARTQRLAWLRELVGQAAAFGAVPAVIVLALALRPGAEADTGSGTETGEVRTIPLWHNASHTASCSTCRLAKRQAGGELAVEQAPASAGTFAPLSLLHVSDGPGSAAQTAETGPALATGPPPAPVPTVTTKTRPILAIEPVTVL
jgi:hypothetical protein